MKVSATKRPRPPGRRLEVDKLRELLHDRRIWAGMGTVTQVGTQPHYRRDGEDVIVDVELHPSGTLVSCRLGSFAGGPGIGLWRIPAVGTEVEVQLPDGDLSYMPTIVGTLSTGQVHERVSDARTVLVAGDEIEIIVGGRTLRVKDGEIQLGAGATDKIIKGTGYRGQEDSFLSQLKAAFDTIASTGGTPTPGSAFAAISAVIAAHQTALSSAAGFLSDKSKTE